MIFFLTFILYLAINCVATDDDDLIINEHIPSSDEYVSNIIYYYPNENSEREILDCSKLNCGESSVQSLDDHKIFDYKKLFSMETFRIVYRKIDQPKSHGAPMVSFQEIRQEKNKLLTDAWVVTLDKTFAEWEYSTNPSVNNLFHYMSMNYDVVYDTLHSEDRLKYSLIPEVMKLTYKNPILLHMILDYTYLIDWGMETTDIGDRYIMRFSQFAKLYFYFRKNPHPDIDEILDAYIEMLKMRELWLPAAHIYRNNPRLDKSNDVHNLLIHLSLSALDNYHQFELFIVDELFMYHVDDSMIYEAFKLMEKTQNFNVLKRMFSKINILNRLPPREVAGYLFDQIYQSVQVDNDEKINSLLRFYFEAEHLTSIVSGRDWTELLYQLIFDGHYSSAETIITEISIINRLDYKRLMNYVVDMWIGRYSVLEKSFDFLLVLTNDRNMKRLDGSTWGTLMNQLATHFLEMTFLLGENPELFEIIPEAKVKEFFHTILTNADIPNSYFQPLTSSQVAFRLSGNEWAEYCYQFIQNRNFHAVELILQKEHISKRIPPETVLNIESKILVVKESPLRSSNGRNSFEVENSVNPKKSQHKQSSPQLNRASPIRPKIKIHSIKNIIPPRVVNSKINAIGNRIKVLF